MNDLSATADTIPAAVVVDTDVVSFLFKGDTRGDLYRAHLTGRIAIIAAQTRAELDLWALQHGWGARRRTRLEQHLINFVLAPFDEEVCSRWAQATDTARRNGRPISCADAWVAATALAYNVPLITHNQAHFVGVTRLAVICER